MITNTLFIYEENMNEFLSDFTNCCKLQPVINYFKKMNLLCFE